MKQFLKLITITVVVASLLLSPKVVAEEMVLQQSGDTKIDRIRDNCESINQTLRRLHTSDSLLRVNIGQVYNGLSVNLMARLNSRLALNRIDSAKFVEITGQFERDRTLFSASYNDYEVALSTLIRTDCKLNPTEFYANLLKARDARHKLSTYVESMNDGIGSYHTEVEKLRQSMAEPKRGSKNAN